MQHPNLNPPIKSVCTTPTSATSDNCVFIVETYKNGAEWYRKYSDGVIEQGGALSGLSRNVRTTFNFITPFTNANTVTIHVTNIYDSVPTTNYHGGLAVVNTTAADFTVLCDGYSDGATTGYWEARGV